MSHSTLSPSLSLFAHIRLPVSPSLSLSLSHTYIYTQHTRTLLRPRRLLAPSRSHVIQRRKSVGPLPRTSLVISCVTDYSSPLPTGRAAASRVASLDRAHRRSHGRSRRCERAREAPEPAIDLCGIVLRRRIACSLTRSLRSARSLARSLAHRLTALTRNATRGPPVRVEAQPIDPSRYPARATALFLDFDPPRSSSR